MKSFVEGSKYLVVSLKGLHRVNPFLVVSAPCRHSNRLAGVSGHCLVLAFFFLCVTHRGLSRKKGRKAEEKAGIQDSEPES
jgi:hypothetical protein